VNFTPPDKNKNSYWGFYLGKQDLPKGTGTMMGQLAIELAFNQLKIRKLCAEVVVFNQISLHFHKKLGFREEGVFARHVLINGNYEDVVCFALFKESQDNEVNQ
jgi:RimJ/RimL family protein N-acetyltransferase